VISYVTIGLKTSVSEITLVSVIRAYVVNDHMSLIFIPDTEKSMLKKKIIDSRDFILSNIMIG
jgi:hypothetical protein